MAQIDIKEQGPREMDAPMTELDERKPFQPMMDGGSFPPQIVHPIYRDDDSSNNQARLFPVDLIKKEIRKKLDLLYSPPGLPVSWRPMSTDNYDGQLSSTQVGFLGTIFTLLLALAFGILTSCRDVYPSASHNEATTDLAIARITYIISGTVMGVLSSLILTYLGLTQLPRGGRGPFYLKCLLLVVMGLVLFILTLLLCSLL